MIVIMRMSVKKLIVMAMAGALVIPGVTSAVPVNAAAYEAPYLEGVETVYVGDTVTLTIPEEELARYDGDITWEFVNRGQCAACPETYNENYVQFLGEENSASRTLKVIGAKPDTQYNGRGLTEITARKGGVVVAQFVIRTKASNAKTISLSVTETDFQSKTFEMVDVTGKNITIFDDSNATGERSYGMLHVNQFPTDSYDAVKFESSDPSIVSICDQGFFKAKKTGTVTLTVTTETGLTETCTVTVIPSGSKLPEDTISVTKTIIAPEDMDVTLDVVDAE